ncbi:MAG TPA: prenyltransferase [Clostridiaceae bacterium]|nr:prenyltransferase [Clostridiaceae bacterium]
MSIKSFLKLVEIRTKLASLMPFLLGTVYALYHFQRFNFINFILMFGSLFIFDMFTTALNNYLDYKRAIKKQGYNYEKHNAIVKYNLTETSVLVTIAILFSLATALGIVLFINTNIIVLLVGMLSFLVGICYSFGPVPISRTPLGEIFSGFFMGFVILFLAAYVHVFDQDIVTLSFESFRMSFNIDIVELLYIFLLSLIPQCGIANIMLANNICDIEDDIENRRYTLPIYIGKERALWVFKAIYYIAFVNIIILVVFKIVPWICIAALLTFIPVNKHIKLFYAEQTKNNTFDLSVKNFLMMTGVTTLLFFAAWLVSLIVK